MFYLTWFFGMFLAIYFAVFVTTKIEKTGKFDGVYHVLHGAISPMLGIGPDDIKLKELMQRLTKDDVKEVKAGFECGIVFEKYNDIKEGDQIEAFVMEEIPR